MRCTPLSRYTRRTKWIPAAALILVLVAVLLVSPGHAAPQPGGTLRIAAMSIQQLDPYKSASNDEIHAFSPIFDTLFIIGREGFEPVPHLAERWENVDDRTWRFYLRRGVRFQDGNAVFPEGQGREVTAEDVVYSIQRFMEVSTAFYLGEIEQVRALDRYTVEIRTAHPDPFLIQDPNRLARVAIVPREAVELLGEDGFAKNPIGSGPFELVRFVPDQTVILQRNEDYWLPVYLDRVEFVFIPDPTVQVIALSAGEVDVIPYLLNVDAAEVIARNPELELVGRGGSYRGIGFNVTKPPFDDWRVRDALSKAMNIDVAVQSVVGSLGERAYGQVPPWVPFGYDPTLAELWEYDPEGALAQLAAAGYTERTPDGFLAKDGKPLSFEIHVIPGTHMRVFTILVTQLRELGIDAKLLQQELGTWVDDLLSGRAGIFFDFSFAGTTGLHSLFHSNSIGRSNAHYYANPEVDALLDQASRTVDMDEVSRLWKAAQRLIVQDRVFIPLYFEQGFSAINRRVRDWVPPWGGLHLVSLENNVYLEGGGRR